MRYCLVKNELDEYGVMDSDRAFLEQPMFMNTIFFMGFYWTKYKWRALYHLNKLNKEHEEKTKRAKWTKV
jgi:hypothetical protein